MRLAAGGGLVYLVPLQGRLSYRRRARVEGVGRSVVRGEEREVSCPPSLLLQKAFLSSLGAVLDESDLLIITRFFLFLNHVWFLLFHLLIFLSWRGVSLNFDVEKRERKWKRFLHLDAAKSSDLLKQKKKNKKQANHRYQTNKQQKELMQIKPKT